MNLEIKLEDLLGLIHLINNFIFLLFKIYLTFKIIMNKDNKSFEPPKDIFENLITNYTKLLSKFFAAYTSMSQWNSIPSPNELKKEEIKKATYKKVKITLNILHKAAVKNNDKEIEHLIKYNLRLFEDENIFSNLSKINVMTGCMITLVKILPVRLEKEKVEELMVQFLETIIRNFCLSFKNSIYIVYQGIAVDLNELNKSKPFFDYELVFVDGDKYFTNELFPRIKEEIAKLDGSFNESITKVFEIDNINLTSSKDIIYLANLLKEMKAFKDFKKEHTLQEYQQYQYEIKEKIKKIAYEKLNIEDKK